MPASPHPESHPQAGAPLRRALLLALALACGAPATHAADGDPLAAPALVELRRRMLDADVNAHTFHNMDQLFNILPVAAGTRPSVLAEARGELDFSYPFEGRTIPAADFPGRTYTNALLIMRDDRIVFERYYNNTGPESRFISMSMAKSITSLLIGMAIDDGAIASVDDRLDRYLPELSRSGYEGVTIRQALMMRSGVDWNERYDFGRQSPMQRLHDAAVVENRIRFVSQAFGLGRAHPPGEAFNYSTVETAVLGAVLESATGKPIAQYMSERFWQRAGMQAEAFWLADGPPGTGRAINGMGFNAVLRDYARIGQMVLDEGVADGRQIVSAAWIRESTRPALPEPVPGETSRGYQYQWWTLAESDAFMAVGLQGQYLYVDPATRTVAVKLSHFPPGEQRADAETEAFLRAVSNWKPAEPASITVSPPGPHPMDPLSADEIRRAVGILRADGRLAAGANFAHLALEEPDKAAVRGWRPGWRASRQAAAVVLQNAAAFEAVVDLDTGRVTRWQDLGDRQPRLLGAEMNVLDVLWAHAPWRDAMHARGYAEHASLFCAPLAPGPSLPREYAGRRLIHVSCFELDRTLGNAFARPIEGLLAIFDVRARAVLRVVDLGAVPVSRAPSSLRYEDSARDRAPARPVEIVAPQGSNVALTGAQVRWDNWRFHLRVDPRVGPVLSLLRYDDGGTAREVLYQLMVSEMYVPYMDPDPTWSWRAYMDVGEYGFGLLASALEPGTDCPASAHFLDATLAGEDGEPITLPGVVCIFERPTGDPLWRHGGEGEAHGRPNVELVVRMAPVIGNYDYLVDYVLDRAGEIEVRLGATGIDAVKGVAAQSLADPGAAADTAYGTLIAPGLAGTHHDHYLSFRIDADIDGPRNRAVLDAFEMQRLPRTSPRRSLWRVAAHTIEREGPLPQHGHDGVLRIESLERRNAMGYAAGYQLLPGHNAFSLLEPNDPIQARAAWSAHPIWLSRYAPDELYASGPYPNSNPRPEGLAAWTAAREDIDGEDLVLWYTVGFRHITRAEDWPAMPTLWHAFRLRPFNFFDISPALDVPPR